MMNGRLLSLMVCIGSFVSALGQRNEQLWLDYQVSYPFANNYVLEISPTYQTVLSPEDKWRSYSLSTTVEYTLLNNLDLTAEIPIAYTTQKDGVNSFEVSPLVGARFHVTQRRRIDTRLFLRYQSRYFRQIEEQDWDVSNRTRIKGEALISINGPNLYSGDNLWHVILDYEEFIVLDQQVDERFANRRRARIGLSYRLNYKHRFEAIYTRQSSRAEIEGGFISNDNVIQLRYKMYLNPAKTTNNN
jgi:hypothetical protein